MREWVCRKNGLERKFCVGNIDRDNECMSEMWSVFGAWGVVENYMNYFEEGKVDEKDEYA